MKKYDIAKEAFLKHERLRQDKSYIKKRIMKKAFVSQSLRHWKNFHDRAFKISFRPIDKRTSMGNRKQIGFLKQCGFIEPIVMQSNLLREELVFSRPFILNLKRLGTTDKNLEFGQEKN